MAKDVFIAHTRAGFPAAVKLAAALHEEGVTSWIDERDVLAGSPWRHEIRSALDGSRAVVFLIESRREPGSRVRDMWGEALESSWDDSSKPTIPLLLNGATSPPFLRDRYGLRIEDRASDWRRAAQSIADVLEGKPGRLGEVDERRRAAARRDYERRLDEIATIAESSSPRGR